MLFVASSRLRLLRADKRSSTEGDCAKVVKVAPEAGGGIAAAVMDIQKRTRVFLSDELLDWLFDLNATRVGSNTSRLSIRKKQ